MQIFLQIIPKMFHFYLILLYVVVVFYSGTIYSVFDFTFYLIFLNFLNFSWILICTYAYFVVTPNDFYIAAAFVGLVMGGIQSLSRSTYSKFIPEDTKDTTSFFSFYDVAEKIGIVIGMFTYGYIADVTGKIQNAILFLILFFVVGLLLLLRVPKK